jgi:hypothetical protein
MPQRPDFDMKSETVAPVFGTVGVFETGDTKQPILGAYYDREPEFAGLYTLLPSGSVGYYEVNPEELSPMGMTRNVEFSVGGTAYMIRDLLESDGEWVSEYKTELPLVVLYQTIIKQSKPAIEKILGVELPDDTPNFEAMYVYYLEGDEQITSLIYMSNFGIYARDDSNWIEADISTGAYQNLDTIEIDPNSADELIQTLDTNTGIMTVAEADRYAAKSTQEGVE